MAFDNTALVAGLVDGAEAFDTAVVTVLEADITITKTATPQVWLGGELTFDITIQNSDTAPFTDVVMTDTLDLTKVEYVPDSVEVTLDGTTLVLNTDYTVAYDGATGQLTVTMLRDIPAGQTAIMTFLCVPPQTP